VQQPGLTGVVDWGGVSIDLDRGVLVTNYMNMPWRGRLIPKTELTEQFVASHTAGMMRGSPYAWRFAPWLSDINIPCMAPPWGRLIAIDLGTQRVLWDRPLGTAEDSGPFGIPTRLPLTIGVPSLSGTLTTRGGLIFISGTADRYVRAIDEATGEEIWHARLPAGAQATPMTYMAGGRQYLLVTSGGNMLMQSKFGDYTIAYVLPKR
jgi:quinoprotein glucose dehydrogenase